MTTLRRKKFQPQAQAQRGYVMAEYIIVSLGMLLTLLAAIDAVDLLLTHHERASAVMQLPL